MVEKLKYCKKFLGGSVLLGLLHFQQNKYINITGTINAYDLN